MSCYVSEAAPANQTPKEAGLRGRAPELGSANLLPESSRTPFSLFGLLELHLNVGSCGHTCPNPSTVLMWSLVWGHYGEVNRDCWISFSEHMPLGSLELHSGAEPKVRFTNFRGRSPELVPECPFACKYLQPLKKGVPEQFLDSFPESSRTSLSPVWFAGTTANFGGTFLCNRRSVTKQQCAY